MSVSQDFIREKSFFLSNFFHFIFMASYWSLTTMNMIILRMVFEMYLLTSENTLLHTGSLISY